MFLPDRDSALHETRLVSQFEGKKAKPMESEAYRARRDCWSPVPLITTSHFVSERDSMVRFKDDERGKEGRETDGEKKKSFVKCWLARGFESGSKLKRSGEADSD
jgi:hypothetical protein